MRVFRKMFATTLVLVVTACGGGSGGGGGITPKADSYIYTGTVPGTRIEAFCDNGAYYMTQSRSSGSERHPFELTLPANLVCRLVMTTQDDDPAGRVVTPVGFTDGNGQTSSAASAHGGSVIDLGHVPLHTSRDDVGGLDANHDGILDAPMSLGRPVGLEVEPHRASTLDADGNGIVDAYDDENHDGIPNRDDAGCSRHDMDRDCDGLADPVDVNPANDPNAGNHYPIPMDHDGDHYLDEDADHDGYYDDDADHDGYHDDDMDHDGYHDDDMNHDGFHDGMGMGGAGPMTYAEVSGTIESIDGDIFVLRVTSAEGIALNAGDSLQVDVSDAYFDHEVPRDELAPGDAIDAHGSYDGTVLQAFRIEPAHD